MTSEVHRTRSARIDPWVLAGGGLLTVVVGVTLFVPGSWWLPFLIAALLFVAALRIRRSGVRVDAEGVTVMNILRDIRVPWSDVEGFEVTDDGPFSGRGRGYPSHGWLSTSTHGWIRLDCATRNVDEAARLVFLLEGARKAAAQPPTSSER